MMKTSRWWIGALAVACLVGCSKKSDSTVDSQPIGANANPLQVRDPEQPQPTIEFGTVTVSRTNPNAIDPCIHVIRGIYQASQSGSDFEVEFNLTYTSRGKVVTKAATVPLARMRTEESHPPEVAKFVNLHTDIDVSTDPPDAGTAISGTAKLLKLKDGSRVVEAETKTQS